VFVVCFLRGMRRVLLRCAGVLRVCFARVCGALCAGCAACGACLAIVVDYGRVDSVGWGSVVCSWWCGIDDGSDIVVSGSCYQ
jgi:hypothetical protein